MIRFNKIASCGLLVSVLCSIVNSASAQAAAPGATTADPCRIKRGDTVASVQAALNTRLEPISIGKVTPGGTAFRYHLPELGVMVFLDVDKKVLQLRFDAPFSGNVGGATIGTTAAQLIAARGAPAGKMQGLYDADDTAARQLQIDALVKTVPLEATVEAVAIAQKVKEQIAQIEAREEKINEAWIYAPGTPKLTRYDVSPTTSKVQTIFTSACN
jgi:hypothetical protein